MEHTVRYDPVERAVREGQMLRVALDDSRIDAKLRKVLLREFDVPGREIDPHHGSACKGELADVDALATADVENIQADGMHVPELFGHPWGILPPRGHQCFDPF